MAHPETEAVGSDAGSEHSIFGKFLDAPEATEENLQETPETPAEQDSGEPEEVEQAEPEESEETEQAEPEEDHPPEAIDPPHSWSKADKEYFNSLPPEVQRVVADRERQRDSFLTQRAETLAEERKAIEAQKSEAEKARSEYLERLRAFQPTLPTPPDPKMIDEDPVEYMRQQAEYQRAQEQAQKVSQERERLSREDQERQQQQYQQFVQEQAKQLSELIPEYRDEAARPQFQKEVAEYALKAGYRPEHLQWATAQDIVTLNKARLYDAMQGATKSVPEKLKTVPKTAKPGQRMTKAEADQNRHREKLQQLRKSGSIDDAAAFFKDIL